MNGLPQTRCLAVAIATPLTEDYHPDTTRLLARTQALLDLGCDGITLFRSDGVLIGYNAFVPLLTRDRPDLGGARRRAYNSLRSYLGKGVNLAIYRSQDGSLDFAEAPN